MTFEEQKQAAMKSILNDDQIDSYAKQKTVNLINNLGMPFTNILLYRENIVKGKVLWIGSSAVSTEYERCVIPGSTISIIADKLMNEDHAYVLMKVKVKNE
jgi:hypothetical protein